MPRFKKEPYTCPRCGYSTISKTHIGHHFSHLKKPCPGQLSNIDLTEEIKQHILDNRVYIPNVNVKPNYIRRLEVEVALLKHRKNEATYQTLLEEVLKGTHKQLRCGITDITTDTFHAEIKKWQDWKSALGQLVSYTQEDPKPEMRLYLFGKINKKTRQTALEILDAVKVQAFEVDCRGVRPLRRRNKKFKKFRTVCKKMSMILKKMRPQSNS